MDILHDGSRGSQISSDDVDYSSLQDENMVLTQGRSIACLCFAAWLETRGPRNIANGAWICPVEDYFAPHRRRVVTVQHIGALRKNPQGPSNAMARP